MPKKTPYEMAEEVKTHPVVQRMQTDIEEDKHLIQIMDEFKKVAKTKDATKKKKMKEIKKENPDKSKEELAALYIESNGKADQDFVTEAEFVTAFTKGIKLKDAQGEKIKVTVEDAKRLFKAADTSRDGFVNFNEFVCLMAIMQKGDAEKKLDLVYRIYDSDKSGLLEESEIRKLLESLLTTADQDEKEKQIRAVMEELMKKHDSDGNKKINQDELKQVLLDLDILGKCLGQNIEGLNFDGAVDGVYNSTVKSRSCAVM